ncbi:MAG: hypothetical protein R3316_05550 [Rhodovibrionaceae bacterium]|nr:hypothetical protein [Rhodovibrionaceae bacterium]
MSEPVNKPLREAAMAYLENQAGEDATKDKGFLDLWAKATKAAVRGGEGITPEEQEGLGRINKAYSLQVAAKAADSVIELNPLGALIEWARGEEAEREENEIHRAMDMGELTMAEAALLAASAPDRPLTVLPPVPAHLNLPPHVGLDAGAFVMDVVEGSVHLRDPLRGRHLFVSRQDGSLLVSDNRSGKGVVLDGASELVLNIGSGSGSTLIALSAAGNVIVVKGDRGVSVAFADQGARNANASARRHPTASELPADEARKAMSSIFTEDKPLGLNFTDLADATEFVATLTGSSAAAP